MGAEEMFPDGDEQRGSASDSVNTKARTRKEKKGLMSLVLVWIWK
jgi:hypothetical protein